MHYSKLQKIRYLKVSDYHNANTVAELAEELTQYPELRLWVLDKGYSWSTFDSIALALITDGFYILN